MNSRFESIPEIIEETQYYKITYSNFKFTYYLYNDKHKIIDKKTLDNCKPQTSILGNKIIKVRIQAGTGVESVWTYYYDINKNLFSKTFDGTFDEYNDLVIYMKNLNVLVVENMFDQKKFYKEINKFKYKLSSIPSTPFSKVKFIDNGQMIKVTYFTENGSKEETETFALK